MAYDIFDNETLAVTSFVGPANTLERTRTRLQFTPRPVHPDDRYVSLGFNDVVALYNALDAWIAEHRGKGGS